MLTIKERKSEEIGMPSLRANSSNHFISSDSLIIDHARQRVIEANGGFLVTPVFEQKASQDSSRLSGTYVKSTCQTNSRGDKNKK